MQLRGLPVLLSQLHVRLSKLAVKVAFAQLAHWKLPQELITNVTQSEQCAGRPVDSISLPPIIYSSVSFFETQKGVWPCPARAQGKELRGTQIKSHTMGSQRFLKTFSFLLLPPTPSQASPCPWNP